MHRRVVIGGGHIPVRIPRSGYETIRPFKDCQCRRFNLCECKRMRVRPRNMSYQCSESSSGPVEQQWKIRCKRPILAIVHEKRPRMCLDERIHLLVGARSPAWSNEHCSRRSFACPVRVGDICVNDVARVWSESRSRDCCVDGSTTWNSSLGTT